MPIYYETPLDRTFHALGDPTRRRMVSALVQRGTQTANELGTPFDISQPSVSKHLKVLEQAGLVVRKIDGRTHSFSLNKVPLEEADIWISRHTKLWQGSLDQLGVLVDDINKQEADND